MIDIEELKKEREKALKDLRRVSEQLIGLQYLVAYFNQKIQEGET